MARRRRAMELEAMETRLLLSTVGLQPQIAMRYRPQSIPQHHPGRRAPLRIEGIVTATWSKSVPVGPEMSATPPTYVFNSNPTDLGSLGSVQASGMILTGGPSSGIHPVGLDPATDWSDGHLRLQGRRGWITLKLRGPDFDPSPQPGSSTATDMTYTVQRTNGTFAGFRSTGTVHVVLRQDANLDSYGRPTGVITFVIDSAEVPKG